MSHLGIWALARRLHPIAYSAIAAGLFLVGLALRLYRLGARSFWLDEVFTAQMVQYQGLPEAISNVRTDNAPLTYLITWLLRGFGGGEWAVRFPYAIAGSLNVLAVYALGRTLGRPRAALVAALLMAISPFSLWYAQDARPYAFLMLFTTLQILFTYRAVQRSGFINWFALVIFSVLNLYTHYLAILVTGASFAFIGFTLAIELVSALRAVPSRLRQVATRVAYAIPAMSATVAAFYLPWGSNLDEFLNRQDLGFGRVDVVHVATLNEITALLANYDLTGVVLLALVIGIVAALLAIRSNWKLSALFAAWLILTFAVFWLKIGGGIVTLYPRYLSFLFPGAVMLAGIGVDSLGRAASSLAARWGNGSPRVRGLAFTGVYGLTVLLLLSQGIPALAHSYEQPKDDYRGVADYILASNPRAPVILALGECSSFVTTALTYYSWLRGSPAVVLDGLLLDDHAIAALNRPGASVWGAWLDACNAPNSAALSDSGIRVRQFAGLTLFWSAANDATALVQAEAIFHWVSLFRPQAGDSLDLLEALAGSRPTGKNVLPAPGVTPAERAQAPWAFGQGAEFQPATAAMVLHAAGPMVNATVNYSVTPQSKYILSFEYVNADFHGEQAVYVSAHDTRGGWLSIFPTGAGYPCAVAMQWNEGAFTWVVPEGTAYLTVWLRATGSGIAEFRNVALRQVQ